MIEISFGKLLVLALIALIVLGPEKLPQAARTAGALVRRLRSSWDSVRAEVERELQVEEIRRTARESVARMDAAQAELDATLKQVREVAAGAAVDAPSSTAAAPAAGDQPPAAGQSATVPLVDAGSAQVTTADAAGSATANAADTAARDHAAKTGADQTIVTTTAGAATAASGNAAPAEASAASPTDTLTGDLFAGTASAAPPAAVTPAERVDGAV